MNSVTDNNKLSITIREMAAKDVDRITALEKLIFPDPWSRSAFEEQISGGGWGGYVAIAKNEIVGYLCTLVVDVEAHVTNIAVLPEYRRIGIARQLLEHFLTLVAGTPVEYILLEVRASNADAQAFYERFGFRFLYRRKNYYRRPIEDALVLVKDLETREDAK